MLALVLLLSLQLKSPLPESISVRSLHREYKLTAPCNIKDVDFRNFKYTSSAWLGYTRPVPPLQVKNGAYHFREQRGFEDLTVEEVKYPPGERASAVVSLWHNYGGGSSNQELALLVFRCDGGKLMNTQVVHGDGHGDGAGVSLSKDGSFLTIKSVDDYSNGHCCPRFLETAQFHWRRGKYVMAKASKVENKYPQ